MHMELPLTRRVVNYYVWDGIHGRRIFEDVINGVFGYSFTNIKTADGVMYKYLILST